MDLEGANRFEGEIAEIIDMHRYLTYMDKVGKVITWAFAKGKALPGSLWLKQLFSPGSLLTEIRRFSSLISFKHKLMKLSGRNSF